MNDSNDPQSDLSAQTRRSSEHDDESLKVSLVPRIKTALQRTARQLDSVLVIDPRQAAISSLSDTESRRIWRPRNLGNEFEGHHAFPEFGEQPILSQRLSTVKTSFEILMLSIVISIFGCIAATLVSRFRMPCPKCTQGHACFEYGSTHFNAYVTFMTVTGGAFYFWFPCLYALMFDAKVVKNSLYSCAIFSVLYFALSLVTSQSFG